MKVASAKGDEKKSRIEKERGSLEKEDVILAFIQGGHHHRESGVKQLRRACDTTLNRTLDVSWLERDKSNHRSSQLQSTKMSLYSI